MIKIPHTYKVHIYIILNIKLICNYISKIFKQCYINITTSKEKHLEKRLHFQPYPRYNIAKILKHISKIYTLFGNLGIHILAKK